MRRFILVLLLAGLGAAPLFAASVDGLEINSTTWTNVNASGSHAPTLIFVHGWTCDSSSWRGQAGPLSRDYRVITLDLPGHGKSDSPQDGKFSMNLFARAVEAVRAEVGAERVVLIGHSMGAPVIREYAHLYPEHVAGLIAVDGPLGRAGGVAPGATGRNLDHLCLTVRGFDLAAITAHLEAHGVAIGSSGERFGASGDGTSLYLTDPEGNELELRA